MEPIDTSLSARLQVVRDSVRKITEQALKDAAASESPMELRFKDSTDGNAEENDDPNNSESFALGMTLFGKDVASVEREIGDKLNKIEESLKEVVTEIQAQEGESNEEENDDDMNSDPEALQAEASMLTARIHFLRECSAARSFLDEATMAASLATPNDPDFVESARLLKEAQSALERAQDVVREEEKRSKEPTPALLGAYRILDAIRDPMRRKRVDLLSRATELLESSITFTSESITVRGGRMGSGHSQQAQGLPAAYDVLETLSPSDSERLDDALKRLVDRLFHVAIKPQLEAHKNGTSSTNAWLFREASDSAKGLTGRPTLTKTPTYTLEWYHDEEKTTTAAGNPPVSPEERAISTWTVTFNFLQRIMSFLEERALLQRASSCEYVGERLFGRPSSTPENSLTLEAFGLESSILEDDKGLFVKPAIQLMWDSCIPSRLKAKDLATLGTLSEQLRVGAESFEREMQRAKFLPSKQYLPFSDFASEFQGKYVEKRRCTLLNEARNILLRTDYHNTVEVGVEVKPKTDDILDEEDGMSVFKLHKCCVSQTSSRLMSLCRNTMDEAVSIQVKNPSSPLAALPATLYRTSREMLDLFRAIIPANHGGEVASIPRTAAVLHNDCVYLAHHCLTLGLEYKDKFPLTTESEDVRGQLLRQTCMFVDMVPPFRELAERSMGDMLEEHQKGQLFEIVGSRIALLGDSLQSNDTLAEWSEAETALKAGLYHLRHLSQAWKPILSHEIFGRSIAFLGDALFTMFFDQVMKATAISESACQFVNALFRSAMMGVSEVLDGRTWLCSTWDKFSAVGRFMDMSLSDIQASLPEGIFRSVTGAELSQLIIATFDQSQKRDHLLQVLSSHN